MFGYLFVSLLKFSNVAKLLKFKIMNIEIRQTANIIINNYLNGSITAIDRDKQLKRNNISLYSFVRGKGRIKATIKFDNVKETLTF